MPTYEHQCEECNYEWEANYSIVEDPPKQCPKCLRDTAKRVISLSGRGVVELTGRDLSDKIKSDAVKLQREASSSEKVYSNLIGEGRYQSIQSKMDKRGK